ncbi:MAG TPA: ATP-binding protein [Candidatus Hydrogenedens sp.]|nr:ATP-binding protein [Candidatus Hydrogenedens sp.]
MFLLFNKSGDIVDFDKEFLEFTQRCLNIKNTDKELWKNLIYEEDRNSFLSTVKKHQSHENYNPILFYRIKPKHIDRLIGVLHIGFSKKAIINEEIEHFALLYPFCNNYLNLYTNYSDKIPIIFQPIIQKDIAYLLAFKGKILYANEKALNILESQEDEIYNTSLNDWFKNFLFIGNSKKIEIENFQNPSLLKLKTKTNIKKYINIYLSNIQTNHEPIHNIFFYELTSLIEAEEKLKLFKYIVDHAGNEFYLLDRKGKFEYVNESSAKSLGYDLNTFSKMGLPEIDVFYTPENFEKHFQSLKKGEDSPFTTIHKHKDGHYVHKEIKSVYLKISEDKEYIFGFGQDITKRKMMEQFWDREHKYSRIILQLSHQSDKNSNQLLAEFLENSFNVTNSISVCLISDEVGRNLVETTENERHKIVYYDKNISNELSNTIERYINDFFDNVNTKRLTETEVDYIKIINDDNTQHNIYCAIIPITDKEKIRDAIIFFRENDTFSDEELEQLYFFCNAVGEIIRKLQIEEHLKIRDKILEATAKCSSLLFLSQNWDEAIKEALKILGESAEVSRTYIFKNRKLSDGSLVTDQIFEWVNDNITPQIDNPELQGFNYEKEGYGRWANMFSKGEPVYGCIKNFPEEEKRVLEPQDIISIAIVPIFVSGKWWGVIGFDDCLTERLWTSAEINALKIASEIISASIEKKTIEQKIKEQEKRLNAIERLYSLGVMASGISHEINNPLAILSLATQHIQNILNNEGELNKEKFTFFVDKLQRNITRIDNIVQSLKLFVRKDIVAPLKIYSLDKIIKDAIELTQPKIEKIKADLKYNNKCVNVKIKAVPTLLTQVFVNLLNNAIEAVENKENPEITINVEENELNIIVTVEDNGDGIPKEIQHKLLEPFFTTKDKGTGLGLPLSKTIIEIHSGNLEFESNTQRTRFFVKIPKL